MLVPETARLRSYGVALPAAAMRPRTTYEAGPSRVSLDIDINRMVQDRPSRPDDLGRHRNGGDGEQDDDGHAGDGAGPRGAARPRDRADGAAGRGRGPGLAGRHARAHRPG